jgi:hypothetical protein
LNALEDRLRMELRAESEKIAPDSIVGLRLAEQTGRSPGTLRRRGTPQWPAWARPLAAAVAVLTVIAGTFVIGYAIISVPPASAPARYSSAPAYYAYTVQGDIYNYVSHGTQYSSSVDGRYIKVRATGTGKLLATISPPKPYNDFSLLRACLRTRGLVSGIVCNTS